MPRQSFSSVCPRRTPPIPVRRLIPAAEKENAPPRKRTDAQKIERKKISSQPAGCSIFLLLWQNDESVISTQAAERL